MDAAHGLAGLGAALGEAIEGRFSFGDEVLGLVGLVKEDDALLVAEPVHELVEPGLELIGLVRPLSLRRFR